MADLAELKEKVVLAREFLLHEGLIQRYGHISCYVPEEGVVLFTPNASAVRGRLRASDIVCTDLDGNVVGGRPEPPPVPVYDDPCVITTSEQAEQLVKVLGSARAAELRGHGSVILGETMERAFAAAIFLEENSKKQLYATLAGQVTYMTPDEIERTGPNISQQALEVRPRTGQSEGSGETHAG